jgi:hypothetical protein
MADQPNPNLQQATGALLAQIPRHTFTIPSEQGLGLPTDPTTITIRELTYGEEMQAKRIAMSRGDANSIDESAKRSIEAADGKPVTWEGDGKERFYAGLSQRARELVQQAYVEIALPKEASRAAFLASRKTNL